jgi:hypothetical protein
MHQRQLSIRTTLPISRKRNPVEIGKKKAVGPKKSKNRVHADFCIFQNHSYLLLFNPKHSQTLHIPTRPYLTISPSSAISSHWPSEPQVALVAPDFEAEILWRLETLPLAFFSFPLAECSFCSISHCSMSRHMHHTHPHISTVPGKVVFKSFLVSQG